MIGKLVSCAYASIACISASRGGTRLSRYCCTWGGIGSLATAIFLALKLQKPLLLEGEAGVGKTEVAKTLATLLGRHLIRLQCYEGLDVNTTIYEWNYTRQMLQIRLLENTAAGAGTSLDEIFGPEFLIKRPLLQAIEASQDQPPILLIDEIDRADEEFE